LYSAKVNIPQLANKGIIMLPRTPLRTPHILTEDDHGHGEEERRQEKIDNDKP
jgi:hypothetical protein